MGEVRIAGRLDLDLCRKLSTLDVVRVFEAKKEQVLAAIRRSVLWEEWVVAWRV